jgi:hypothetical protein
MNDVSPLVLLHQMTAVVYSVQQSVFILRRNARIRISGLAH